MSQLLQIMDMLHKGTRAERLYGSSSSGAEEDAKEMQQVQDLSKVDVERYLSQMSSYGQQLWRAFDDSKQQEFNEALNDYLNLLIEFHLAQEALRVHGCTLESKKQHQLNLNFQDAVNKIFKDHQSIAPVLNKFLKNPIIPTIVRDKQSNANNKARYKAELKMFEEKEANRMVSKGEYAKGYRTGMAIAGIGGVGAATAFAFIMTAGKFAVVGGTALGPFGLPVMIAGAACLVLGAIGGLIARAYSEKSAMKALKKARKDIPGDFSVNTITDKVVSTIQLNHPTVSMGADAPVQGQYSQASQRSQMTTQRMKRQTAATKQERVRRSNEKPPLKTEEDRPRGPRRGR